MMHVPKFDCRQSIIDEFGNKDGLKNMIGLLGNPKQNFGAQLALKLINAWSTKGHVIEDI